MKIDKETLLTIVFCVALMLAWPSISRFFGWGGSAPETEAPVEESAVPSESASPKNEVPAGQTPSASAAAAPAVTPAKPMPFAALANRDLVLQIQPVDGAVVKIFFPLHRHSDGQTLEAETQDAFGIFRENAPGTFLTTGTPVVKQEGNSCEITRTIQLNRQPLLLTQLFTLSDAGYVIRCRYSFRNTGKEAVTLDKLILSGGNFAPWHEMSGDKIRGTAYRMDYKNSSGECDDISGDKKDEKFFLLPPPSVRWAGVSSKYFCSVLDNEEQMPFDLFQRREYRTNPENDDYPLIAVGARLGSVHLAPGEEKVFSYRLYIGPKDSEQLKAFEPDAVDVMHVAWGPLDPIAKALLAILNFFNRFLHSFGWSIIMLTLLVRIVFYPLTARGNESMKKMQRVQPLFKELREKYKDNPQLLNQKMSELYRKEGVNPFAGCLPILLQIPIFFALYQMLDSAIELRHVSFLWCKNLAAADTVASIPIPFLNWSLPINPLVLAMTALMVVQQRMTPAAMDPAQKKMMALMPIVMLLFLYDLPSGLTLYWTVSNLFSIIQLWLQKKRGRNSAPAAEQK